MSDTLTLPEIVLKEEFTFDGRLYRDERLASLDISRSVSPSGRKVVHVTEYATADHPAADIHVTDFVETDSTVRLGVDRHRDDDTWVRISVDLDLAAARALYARLGEVLNA